MGCMMERTSVSCQQAGWSVFVAQGQLGQVQVGGQGIIQLPHQPLLFAALQPAHSSAAEGGGNGHSSWGGHSAGRGVLQPI